MTGIGNYGLWLGGLTIVESNPDKPVGAERKSRFIGELKIEDLWMSLRSVIIKKTKK